MKQRNETTETSRLKVPATYGRTGQRHEKQNIIDTARAQAQSWRAKVDRRRRQVLIEGSFADAANNHGFKRSRWRRLWRQQIQDWLIAGIQNLRTLLKATKKRSTQVNSVIVVDFKPRPGPFLLLIDAWRLIMCSTTLSILTLRDGRFINLFEMTAWRRSTTSFWATRP